MAKTTRHDEINRLFVAIRTMHQRNRTVANLYGSSKTLAEGHATVEVAATPAITPSHLALRLGLSTVTTTRLLKKAQLAGLVRTKINSKDRRVRNLFLGPKAEKFLYQNLERNIATFGAAYERLPTQGRKRFQHYLNALCNHWPAPIAAVTAKDPPLMMEIRRLTRALGLLEERLSFAPWCSPLKWHVLTFAHQRGRKGISTEVLCSSLAAAPRIIDKLLRTMQLEGLVRCGRRHARHSSRLVFLTDQGAIALSTLESSAHQKFDRSLQTLSTEQLQEFSTLWEHYSGAHLSPLSQAITKGTILENIDLPSPRAHARRFIVEQRAKQKLLRNLPERIIAHGSVVFILNRFRAIAAAIEFVDHGNGEWITPHFLIDASQVSSTTLRQLVPILLQNAFLLTSANRITFERLHTSHSAWSAIAGNRHDELTISFTLSDGTASH